MIKRLFNSNLNVTVFVAVPCPQCMSTVVAHSWSVQSWTAQRKFSIGATSVWVFSRDQYVCGRLVLCVLGVDLHADCRLGDSQHFGSARRAVSSGRPKGVHRSDFRGIAVYLALRLCRECTARILHSWSNMHISNDILYPWVLYCIVDVCMRRLFYLSREFRSSAWWQIETTR